MSDLKHDKHKSKTRKIKESDIIYLKSILDKDIPDQQMDIEKMGTILLSTSVPYRTGFLAELKKQNPARFDWLKQTMNNILEDDLFYKHASLEGSNGRFFKHRYEVSNHRSRLNKSQEQKGDQLKTSILYAFKMELLAMNTQQEVEQFQKSLQSRDEYKILIKGQGVLTRTVPLKTDSLDALERLIEQRKRQIKDKPSLVIQLEEMAKSAQKESLLSFLQSTPETLLNLKKDQSAIWSLTEKSSAAKYIIERSTGREARSMIKNLAINTYLEKKSEYLRKFESFGFNLVKAYIERYDGTALSVFYEENKNKSDEEFFKALSGFEFSTRTKKVFNVLMNIHDIAIKDRTVASFDKDTRYLEHQRQGIYVKFINPAISFLEKSPDQQRALAVRLGRFSQNYDANIDNWNRMLPEHWSALDKSKQVKGRLSALKSHESTHDDQYKPGM